MAVDDMGPRSPLRMRRPRSVFATAPSWSSSIPPACASASWWGELVGLEQADVNLPGRSRPAEALGRYSPGACSTYLGGADRGQVGHHELPVARP